MNTIGFLFKKYIDMKKVIGSVSISYSVYCPHCGEYLDDYSDREWWDKSIDMADGLKCSHDVECPKCNKEFEIKYFEH